MELKKTLLFLAALMFCFPVSDVDAQTKTNKKTSVKSPKTKNKKNPKTISGGVMNGKALELFVPVYHQSALVTKIYGQVQVQVLIDINGKVLTANVISGNPLLRNSCIAAAMKSKFSPVEIGGESVRINGFIYYNFLPEKWNWLEIGFILQFPFSSYYSTENLTDYFPVGFDEEIELLNRKTENQDQVTEIVIASIQNKLSEDSKSAWLFSLGLTLGKIKDSCCGIDGQMNVYAQDLRNLIQTKPENVSPILISKLENFILYLENSKLIAYDSNGKLKIRPTLQELEENFPIFGK